MEWPEIAPYLADVLVLAGVLIITIGAYGAFRLRSIFNKLHAASVVVAFGVIAVSLAAMLSGEPAMITRALLIATILAVTAPIATFSMARSAHYGKLRGDEEKGDE